MNDTRAELGAGPLLLIGLALFVSWFAHDMDNKGAAAILLFLIIFTGYGLTKALLGRHVLPFLLLALAMIAVYAIGQVMAALIITGRLTRPIDTNVLAPVMLAAFLLAVKEKQKLPAALYFAALVIAGSLAGFLALGAVYVVSPFGKRDKFWWLPIIMIGAGLVGLTVLGNTHGGIPERLHIMSVALTLWTDNPWLGAGPGGFYALGSGFAHAHNIWTQAAADLGLAGLIAVVSVVGFYMLAIERSKAPRWGWALLAALLVEGMFDFVYWVPQASILLLLIADEVIDASGVSVDSGVSASTPDNRPTYPAPPPPA